MGRLLKILGYLVVAIVALIIIGGIAFSLFFDANDFREQIEEGVEESTGRELTIEGDIELSIFPWLALDVGPTRLGNAPGFGDEPMLSFEKATLSVKLLPILLRREVTVGSAELQSLRLNLAVDSTGTGNWEDLAAEGEDEPAPEASARDGRGVALDISSIDVSDASLVYADAQTGDRYSISNMNLKTGRVAAGESIPLEGKLSFDMQPAGMSGDVELETIVAFDADAGTVTLDKTQLASVVDGVMEVPAQLGLAAPRMAINTKAQTVDAGEVDIYLADVEVSADVEPFSYAGSVEPKAAISVAAFSPRSLMQQLNIEVPETADPAALSLLRLNASADVSEFVIDLKELELVLDDTRFTGSMRLPRSSDGTFRVELVADSIDLNRYMAPAAEESEAAAGEAAPIEIPAELLRPLRARGSLKVGSASLGAILFEDVDLGLKTEDGKLRLNPLSSKLFGGSYTGDVRVDVSGATPVVSVDETIAGVSLSSLAKAMFGKGNITGSISGNYKLSGRGKDTAELQQTLNGSMKFELLDGAWEGVDLWYELRRARALFRQQQPPEPVLPARTEFSSVKATGVVTDGIFQNDDLFAELPFMQVSGNGAVNLPTATVNYRLTARVLEKPEFVKEATAEELDDFTKAVIPLKISGPLASPSIAPDIETMLKKEVEKKIKEEIFDKLLGGDSEGEEGEEPEDPEDALKNTLKDLLKR